MHKYLKAMFDEKQIKGVRMFLKKSSAQMEHWSMCWGVACIL